MLVIMKSPSLASCVWCGSAISQSISRSSMLSSQASSLHPHSDVTKLHGPARTFRLFLVKQSANENMNEWFVADQSVSLGWCGYWIYYYTILCVWSVTWSVPFKCSNFHSWFIQTLHENELLNARKWGKCFHRKKLTRLTGLLYHHYCIETIQGDVTSVQYIQSVIKSLNLSLWCARMRVEGEIL